MKLVFRPATGKDIPQMKTLWRLCFPEDDEAFIDRFFSKIPIDLALVACKGEAFSALFLLPAEVRAGGECYPVRYLYAGCTHPDHRREGLFTQLLKYAADFTAASGGAAIYLRPATPDLAGYYEKNGYRPGIGGWTCTGNKDAIPVEITTASGYLAARNRLLPADRPVWRLLPPADDFFIDELLADGWSAVANEHGCSLMSPDGKVGYDCIGFLPTVSCFGADASGEWQNTAWWIPTGGAYKLISAMTETLAYTAFLGDI